MQTVLGTIGLIGGLLWAFFWAYGLAFCEAYNCDRAVANRELLLIFLMLVAMAGTVWSTRSKGPRGLRNTAIWLGIETAFALTALLPS
jgi:hypothetical protein